MINAQISRFGFLYFILMLISGIVSCTDINEIESRVDNLETLVSVSISKQIESIQLSLRNLENSSNQLSDLVTTMEGDVALLKKSSDSFSVDVSTLRNQIETSSSDIKTWAQGLFSTLNQYDKISKDITEIRTALSELNGLNQTVAQLKEDFEAREREVNDIKASLSEVLKDIDTIKKQISKIIESVQSVVVIPDYADGSVLMTGSESNEIKFEVYPLSAADSIARIGVSALSLDYVLTSTRSGDVLKNIPLRDVSFNDNLLTIVADGTALQEDIILGEQPINARLKVSDGTVTRSSEFFNLYFNKNACLTLKAELLMPTSVRLYGYAEGLTDNPNGVTVGFEYGTSPEMEDAISINVDDATEKGSFSTTLNALEPEKAFFFRAFRKEVNRIDYGDTKSFVTSNYEMVDMGLSVMWATCNVGAKTESDIGAYFAWGELEEKEDYRIDNYEDPRQSLLSEQYDVATQKMGGKWRMPTRTELRELIDECEIQWVSNYNGTGVPGILVTGNTQNSSGERNSIFLPRTRSFVETGDDYIYWSSSSGTLNGYGSCLYGGGGPVYQKKANLGISESYHGMPIRPVWGERKEDATELILEDVSLLVGEDITVSCEILPENVHSRLVTWRIEDNDIASIDFTKNDENSCTISGNNVGVTRLFVVGPSNTSKQVNITVKERTYSAPPLVDMGLSVKWAAYNLGASSPEEKGVLCLWGDDEVGDYDGRLYKWWTPQNYRSPFWIDGIDDISLLGYNPDSSLGEVDNQGVLKPEDDLASIKLGEDWHIPTRKEWEELLDNTTKWWVNDYQQTGISGTLFISNVPGYTDNQVFIPNYGQPVYDQYWSSTVSPFIYSSYAYPSRSNSLSSGFGTITVPSTSLELGARGHLGAIRPVFGARKTKTSRMELSHSYISVREWEEIPLSASFSPENPQSDEIRWTIEDENVVYLDYSGNVTNLKRLHSASVGRTTIVATSVDGGFQSTCDVVVRPAEYNTDFVDLGLGVKWAKCNLGAITPDEPGLFFRWGETVPIKLSDNSYSSYPWTNWETNPITTTKYNRDWDILDFEDDAAHVRLGGKWRMPTFNEMSQLATQCTWTLVNNYENSSVNGYLVTGKNGNSIFFPLAGYYNLEFGYKNEDLAVWTSSSYEGIYAKALHCSKSGSGPEAVHQNKIFCFSIRPVYDE